MTQVKQIIAKSLKIPDAEVTDELGFHSIPQWDSLAHVNLMLALEEAFGTRIDSDQMLELATVASIRRRFEGESGASDTRAAKEAHSVKIHRGLAGVVFDHSGISEVDGQKGELSYRGYSIHDLVERSSFEETAFLLIHGRMPDASELSEFDQELRRLREVPPVVLSLIRELREAHPMDVLRVAVSALAARDPERARGGAEAARRRGVRLLAQAPVLLAAHHAARLGREVPTPDPALAHAANFLKMLHGSAPRPEHARILDRDLILHAEHSSNASTFTARIAASARSDFHAAITAAIATFSGSIHGGALEDVMKMLAEIGRADAVPSYVRQRLERGQEIMGFGHRVYRTEDPRARHLREMARTLSLEARDTERFEIVEELVRAMARYTSHGLVINVDLYAGVAYRHLGVPEDLFVPLFVMSRIAGWTAHVAEQLENNVLIRPLLAYSGPRSRAYGRA